MTDFIIQIVLFVFALLWVVFHLFVYSRFYSRLSVLIEETKRNRIVTEALKDALEKVNQWAERSDTLLVAIEKNTHK